MKRALALALMLVLLAGCSTVRIVYDNADTYLHWRLGAYLEVHDAMADELDERIADFMAWHRAQALPKYAELADDAARRFSRKLQPADLVWGYDAVVAQAREGLHAAAERMAPLLDSLTQEQVRHLEHRLAHDERKFARDNLRGGERERRMRRTERNIERLEDWVGRLSQAQRERVALYSARAPMLEELRAQEQKRLHRELLALVRAKEARRRLPDFAAHWDRGRDPAYVAALEAARREYYAMALDIDESLTAAQRARGAAQLRRYAEDFRLLARRRHD